SMSSLQSLHIYDIHSNLLVPILDKLTALPRLFSLSFIIANTYENIDHIYQLIFALPKLKSISLTINSIHSQSNLLTYTKKRQNTIEYLSINHQISVDQLFDILTYTLHICRLKVHETEIYNRHIHRELPIELINLRHISIGKFNGNLNHFEKFLSEISCKLTYLYINLTCGENTFLNGDQWKRLILQYLPELKKHHLGFNNRFHERIEYSIDSTPSDSFNTSFWIERQDVLEIQIFTSCIQYFIHRYKKRWYNDMPNNIVNSSVELSKSTRLTIVFINPNASHDIARVFTRHLSIIVHIYHLEIQINDFLFQTLFKIMRLVPELITLKIRSLSSDRSIDLSYTDLLEENPEQYRNKIAKIYLETMSHIEEFYLLLELCPSMTYFKVDHTHPMNIEHVLRSILIKINNDHNDHLRLLCFRIPTSKNGDNTIAKLEKMINDENLLLDYEIKRVCNNVYVEWK
ncbi:unnamed protein product, partial [Rotaria sp. Silwood1]